MTNKTIAMSATETVNLIFLYLLLRISEANARNFSYWNNNTDNFIEVSDTNVASIQLWFTSVVNTLYQVNAMKTIPAPATNTTHCGLCTAYAWVISHRFQRSPYATIRILVAIPIPAHTKHTIAK